MPKSKAEQWLRQDLFEQFFPPEEDDDDEFDEVDNLFREGLALSSRLILIGTADQIDGFTAECTAINNQLE